MHVSLTHNFKSATLSLRHRYRWLESAHVWPITCLGYHVTIDDKVQRVEALYNNGGRQRIGGYNSFILNHCSHNYAKTVVHNAVTNMEQNATPHSRLLPQRVHVPSSSQSYRTETCTSTLHHRLPGVSHPATGICEKALTRQLLRLILHLKVEHERAIITK